MKISPRNNTVNMYIDLHVLDLVSARECVLPNYVNVLLRQILRAEFLLFMFIAITY